MTTAIVTAATEDDIEPLVTSAAGLFREDGGPPRLDPGQHHQARRPLSAPAHPARRKPDPWP